MPDQAPNSWQTGADKGGLPAPYVNPWGALQRDLLAVLADLRLRMQELWRRNREGGLPVPDGWPRDLAPLFWPFVVALSLLVLVAGSVEIVRLWPARSTAPPLSAALQDNAPPSSSSPIALAPEQPAIAPPSPVDSSSAAEPLPNLPAAENSDLEAVVHEPIEIAPPPSDPLLVMLREVSAPLADGDVQKILVKAMAMPARNGVDLTLAGGWKELPSTRREQLADQWWKRLNSAGYSELTLRTEQGAVLGRSARVGHGMLLFDLASAEN